MKILDRYIILQFLLNFVILFVVIMMLFVLVDLIVDLDEFLSAGRDRATGQRMFNIALEFEDDLSKGAISEDLRAVFQANGIGDRSKGANENPVPVIGHKGGSMLEAELRVPS